MGPADGSSPRMPEPGDLLLGRFRIESVIGEGGMGLVFGARVLPNETRVAIKILSPTASVHPDGIPRFVNEARATTKLTSPHVVKVFEAGTLDIGLPFIVMELLEGSDLGALVASRGPLPVSEAVDYVIQAADAVAEAHAHGIVHRDLKPSNLFHAQRAGSTPIVKVLDFGVSKIANDNGGPKNQVLTAPGAFLGSPHYMSPEQLKSARDVDGRADIWSFGIILHELLTAQLPFGGVAFPEIVMNVLRSERTPVRSVRPAVPEGLELVVDRCLRRPREERFADLVELAKALAPFATPEGARAAERVGRPSMPRLPIPAPGAPAAKHEQRPFASTAKMQGVPFPSPGLQSAGNAPPGPPGPPASVQSAPGFAMPSSQQLPPQAPGSNSSGDLPRLPPSSPALPSSYAAGQAPQPPGSAGHVWGEGPAEPRGPSQWVVAIGVGAIVFGLVGIVLIVVALRARAHATELDPMPPAVSGSPSTTIDERK